VHCDILPLAYAVRDLDLRFCSLTDHDVSYVKAERLARQRRNPAARLFIKYEAMKLKRLERNLPKLVDLIVTVSAHDRNLLNTLNSDGQYAVIENGVDVSAFAPHPAAIVPDHLLWVGGFSQYANYEAVRHFLQDVYPAIKRARPAVTFSIVGGGGPDRLRSLIGNDSSVVTTGLVDDTVPYFQRATVFVAPILSGGGTKLKILEAMAAGKAIVSTSIGMEGIEGRENEHYVIADDPAVFADKVVSLLGDPAYSSRLGHNARLLVEDKYDWRAICQKMSDAYLLHDSSDSRHVT
jgi:glycosyltransferase involved in cell wall biosynthesis